MSRPFTVIDEATVTPAMAHVHEAGWQSWSPSGTYPAQGTSPRPQHDWQQLMRFRPGPAPAATGFQSEGVLAVEDGRNGPTRLYSPVKAPDGNAPVPTLRAVLHAQQLTVSADGPIQVTEVEGGIADALIAFGDDWATRCEVQALTAPPSVWCSWYHYFLDVTPHDIEENLAAMQRLDLPFDVVQIDDGWQAGIGDWGSCSDRFRALPDLVNRIRDSGRRAGIWAAPLTVGSDSRLARQHPEWLIGDGGRNWGQSLHGLDITHPDAAAQLVEDLRAMRALGIDYVKLDFLYTGALAGRRHEDIDPVTAYRRGLKLVREALGEDTYLLGCGAPLLPSVGLVDAMRVSADVHNPEDDEPGTTRLRGLRAIKARAWQHGRFWVNDPDCLIARPTFPLRHQWADTIERFGGLRSASDRIDDLDDWGLEATRRLLSNSPPPSPFPAQFLEQAARE
jgi:alpha-galactosidase